MTALPLTSRFQIVDRPVAHPGKCCVCGATDRECVDFGMDLEDYGAVYFCLDCMREGGLAAGLIHPDAHADVKLGAEQSLSDYLTKRDLKLVTNEFYELCNNLVSRVPDAFPDSDVHLDSDDSESDDETDGSERQELQSGSDESDETSGQVDKPSGKRRSSSVPANPGDESIFRDL